MDILSWERTISKFLIHDFVDASRDFRVRLVENLNGVFNLLASVKRWPESCDGEQAMKPNLLVSRWLQPLQSLKFRPKLLVVSNDRLVISFPTDFVAEKDEQT